MTERLMHWLRDLCSIALIYAAIATAVNAQTPAPATTWPCRFSNESIVACRGSERVELAAEMWSEFRHNGARMNRAGIKAWIAGRGCAVVHSPRGKVWEIYGHGSTNVATRHGFENVHLILLARIGTPLVVSSHYLVGRCPADEGAETFDRYHPSGT